MAEAAATAIGIAGVVGVLQSLLQCYRDFLAAREFGDDFAILQLRAALLENSTTSWAIAVGLIDESGLERKEFLVARPTQKNIELVRQTLGLIRKQLDTANQELATYTDSEPTPRGSLAAENAQTPIATDTKQKVDVFPLAIGEVSPKNKHYIVERVGSKIQRMVHRQHDQEHPGTLKRTVWALVDKGRLEDVLNKVTTLVDRLNTDFAPINQRGQFDKYCQYIHDLKLTEEELKVIGESAADKLSQMVLKLLGNERQTGNRFTGINITKEGTMNIGDYYDNEWVGEGRSRQHNGGDVFENISVTDTAFMTVGNHYGGKSPLQMRFEQQQQAAVRAKAREV